MARRELGSGSGAPVVAVAGAPGESLGRAAALIRETAPKALDTLRLGGGTALAAMWGHRLSTDIDLVCDAATFETLRADHSPLLTALRRLHEEGRIPRPRFSGRLIGWEYPDSGEVGIVPGSVLGEELLSEATDAATGIPLVAPRRILHAKLSGRVAGGRRLLARDGYDLACAYQYDADAIGWATGRLAEGERTVVGRLMEAVLESPRRILDGRPLLQCRHSRVAHDPWQVFASLHLGRSMVEEHFPISTDPASRGRGLPRR